MAQQAQALSVATRYAKPANFGGTPTAWRALCEVYSSAETPDVIMAVVEYCAVRKLDPYKRPVHIVPMYNRRLRRKVQVVMQGINEVEITASRTGKWAGMDPPKWGPEIEQTFRGSFEDDNGNTTATEVVMRYPEWCMVTVYRMLGEQRVAWTEQLWWTECYARASFRSAVPNARWQQAPRQMLHKCAKAAVLRAAFPEEGFDYTAEEMEGRETDGGFIIDGVAEPGGTSAGNGAASGVRPDGTGPVADAARRVGITTTPPPPTNDIKPTETREAARDRQAEVYAPPTIAEQLESEPDQGAWLKVVERLSREAPDLETLGEIATHRAVREALDRAPSLIRANLREWLRAAHQRLAPPDEAPADDTPPPDPIADLLAEVAAMDLETIEGLRSNAVWRRRNLDLFPMDADRLDEAITQRKRSLTETKESDHADPARSPDTGP